MSISSGKPLDSSMEELLASEEGQNLVLKAAARGEPMSLNKMTPDLKKKLNRYKPLYKHPLPLSDNRPTHEVELSI